MRARIRIMNEGVAFEKIPESLVIGGELREAAAG
jgi:hypothetical protein